MSSTVTKQLKIYNIYPTIYYVLCFLKRQPYEVNSGVISFITLGFRLLQVAIHTFITQKFFLGDIVMPLIKDCTAIVFPNVSPTTA